MEKNILRVALPSPLRRLFDYLPPAGGDLPDLLTPGIRVRVPFGQREMVGILESVQEHSEVPLEKLRPALALLDEIPVLDKTLCELCLWVADYYHEPLGEIMHFALPTALREGKALNAIHENNLPASPPIIDFETPQNLNQEQALALQQISDNLPGFHSFLLQGVTGSGKTEVYLQLLEKILSQQKQALLLVPEIGLTPQMRQRFTDRFGDVVAMLHSGMTDKQRLIAWEKLRSGEKRIAIGTRSAIFASMPELGMIIVDEEHDLSFKQQDGLRYSARDVAIVRARLQNIPIVLGSATPSLESVYNSEIKRYTKIRLTQRVGEIALPQLKVIDIRKEKLQGGLSHVLRQAMMHHLEKDRQVMLFLNRRGFSPILLCHACGWIATCKRCDRAFTWHAGIARLRCHHCDGDKSQPVQCGACESKDLQPVGHGTERIEQAVEELFPQYPIARLDRDNTRKKGSLEALLDSIHKKESRILLGTQMLAKGHHFPDISLVGILDVDGGLFSSDFRGAERMAQLITQVAGRAGREKHTGEVFIQTRHPESVILQQLIVGNYEAFAQTALEERKSAMLPPYAFLVLLRAEAIKQERPFDFLEKVRNHFMQMQLPELRLLGPAPAPMARRAGRFRAQLVLQAASRKILHQALKAGIEEIESWPLTRQVRWSVDVDPQEMY